MMRSLLLGVLLLAMVGPAPARAGEDPEAAQAGKQPASGKAAGVVGLLGRPRDATFSIQIQRGALSGDEARRALSRHEMTLASTCGVSKAAQLELSIVVEPGGWVGKIVVQRSSGNAKLDECVLRRVRTARFPVRGAASQLRLSVALRASLASVFGQSDEGQGALFGNAIGEARGVGGLGLKGTGAGGTGGTIGIGRIGTIGHGKGTGSGYGLGQGRLGGRRVPQVQPGSPTTTVDGSKEIIRRIIRRQLMRLRYCYEREILRDPKLQGRLVVSFAINSDGTVGQTALSSSTMGSKNVEECVVAQFKSLQFPHLSDGVVRVSYPIAFLPAPTNAP